MELASPSKYEVPEMVHFFIQREVESGVPPIP